MGIANKSTTTSTGRSKRNLLTELTSQVASWNVTQIEREGVEKIKEKLFRGL